MPMQKPAAMAGKSKGRSSKAGGGYRSNCNVPGGGGERGRATGSSSSRVSGGIQGGKSHGGNEFSSGNTRGGPTSVGPSRNRPGAGGGPDQHGMSQQFTSGGRSGANAQPRYPGGLPNERAPRAHTGYGRGNG